jgi:hypothetical protein
MTKQPTPEQARRCRGGAYELRQRARQLLEDAQMLDDWPALHLTMADLAWIADAPGDAHRAAGAGCAEPVPRPGHHHRSRRRRRNG